MPPPHFPGRGKQHREGETGLASSRKSLSWGSPVLLVPTDSRAEEPVWLGVGTRGAGETVRATHSWKVAASLLAGLSDFSGDTGAFQQWLLSVVPPALPGTRCSSWRVC